MLNVPGAGESVVSPALDDDISDEQAISRTDAHEPLLEGVSGGEVEGLRVQVVNGFISDGLVETQDNWLESGAVRFGCTLALDLPVVAIGAMVGSLHGAAKEVTAAGLAGEAKIPGRLDEAFLVDHVANLKWQLHEREWDVLDLLDLLSGLLGGLLLLLGLELSLDSVRSKLSSCVQMAYLVSGELIVRASFRHELSGIELGLGDMVL